MSWPVRNLTQSHLRNGGLNCVTDLPGITWKVTTHILLKYPQISKQGAIIRLEWRRLNATLAGLVRVAFLTLQDYWTLTADSYLQTFSQHYEATTL